MADPKRDCNPREAKFCIEFGFPANICCAGCGNFATAPKVGLSIDSREPVILERMNRLLSKRATELGQIGIGITHKSKSFICQKPWLKEGGTHLPTIIDFQKAFIRKHFGDVPAPAETIPVAIPEATVCDTHTL